MGTINGLLSHALSCFPSAHTRTISYFWGRLFWRRARDAAHSSTGTVVRALPRPWRSALSTPLQGGTRRSHSAVAVLALSTLQGCTLWLINASEEE